jgi:hypothetical protein
MSRTDPGARLASCPVGAGAPSPDTKWPEYEADSHLYLVCGPVLSCSICICLHDGENSLCLCNHIVLVTSHVCPHFLHHMIPSL